jgi:hypothetical protein
MKKNNAITDIPGIEVGQAQDDEALTGCTVILCRKGAVGGVDVRGSAPGTRETDLLDPINLVDKVHAVMLAGGSAFGLDIWPSKISVMGWAPGAYRLFPRQSSLIWGWAKRTAIQTWIWGMLQLAQQILVQSPKGMWEQELGLPWERSLARVGL